MAFIEQTIRKYQQCQLDLCWFQEPWTNISCCNSKLGKFIPLYTQQNNTKKKHISTTRILQAEDKGLSDVSNVETMS